MSWLQGFYRFLKEYLMRLNITLVFLTFGVLFQACSNGIERDKFEVSFLNFHGAEAYSLHTVLTDKELKVILKSDLDGVKDTLLFSKQIQYSDTIRLISEINLNKLKKSYSNPCISDGSQITVVLKKGRKTKSVHLSNFYHEDIGKMVYLINSLVPEKYKIWYDKEFLLGEYKRCNVGK
jgi:hypothetical protein